jgi:hypothetical protein
MTLAKAAGAIIVTVGTIVYYWPEDKGCPCCLGSAEQTKRGPRGAGSQKYQLVGGNEPVPPPPPPPPLSGAYPHGL